MTCDRIFERMNVLQSELRRVSQALSRGERPTAPQAMPQAMPQAVPQTMPQAVPELPVVQGQVVPGEVAPQWQPLPERPMSARGQPKVQGGGKMYIESESLGSA